MVNSYIKFWAPILFIGLLSIKCGKDDNQPIEDIESVGEMELDTSKKIYIPSEFSSGEFDNDQDDWSWIRSRQSENFIVFGNQILESIQILNQSLLITGLTLIFC